MELPKGLIDLIKEDGFSINKCENIYSFSKCSPHGFEYDFEFSVDEAENLENFLYGIHCVYSDFDISEETYQWLDNSGHGTNGAPYDMRDIYDDIECCATYIIDLYNIVKHYIECDGNNNGLE